ncbi:hypothetical protein AN286_09615 [Aliarcobacter cryaerophilus ATCC 43158]|uniref:Uncharacterized protein n=1 Tax=Aliarcobacter cryaerophilus ATCC 43158 TaxID=1032070 RepID=A0AAD0XAS2_9BACT|nr:hypothetical protein [Aliarcobacter cryaerophilus]AYJ80426.1 hypothetical protein ACRYA_1302 [Aliarcobacter cryaerophilus ATCC 43158]PRM95106.1 hypothetical protein CJ667_09320 [Aliarcobacter cryaerophilus]QCZ24640.1 hypothetical protein AN286_09615 [Aliarcobacter cryaerophilus ATCC 43158]
MKNSIFLFIFFIVQSLNASLNLNVGGSSSSVNGEKLMKYGVTPDDIKYNDVFNDFSPKR